MRLPGILVLIALLIGGCLGPPIPPPPKMHHAPGGGYVRGDTSYHGTMGL
jgi:hypothetical protein